MGTLSQMILVNPGMQSQVPLGQVVHALNSMKPCDQGGREWAQVTTNLEMLQLPDAKVEAKSKPLQAEPPGQPCSPPEFGTCWFQISSLQNNQRTSRFFEPPSSWHSITAAIETAVYIMGPRLRAQWKMPCAPFGLPGPREVTPSSRLPRAHSPLSLHRERGLNLWAWLVRTKCWTQSKLGVPEFEMYHIGQSDGRNSCDF